MRRRLLLLAGALVLVFGLAGIGWAALSTGGPGTVDVPPAITVPESPANGTTAVPGPVPGEELPGDPVPGDPVPEQAPTPAPPEVAPDVVPPPPIDDDDDDDDDGDGDDDSDDDDDDD